MGSGIGNSLFFASGGARLTYYLEIASGVVGQIPINVFATTSVSVKGKGMQLDAEARFQLMEKSTGTVLISVNTFDDNGSLHSDDVTGDFVNGFKGGTHIAMTPLLATNTLYQVDMSVGAGSRMPFPFSNGALALGSATSFVDPVFELGAGLSPDTYHLIFSDGIHNTAPASVPLPAPWVLFSMGLVGLAAFRRQT